jgi:hypothetical protein
LGLQNIYIFVEGWKIRKGERKRKGGVVSDPHYFSLHELYSLMHNNMLSITSLFLMSLDLEGEPIRFSAPIKYLIVLFREILTKLTTTAVAGRNILPEFSGDGGELTREEYTFERDVRAVLISPFLYLFSSPLSHLFSSVSSLLLCLFSSVSPCFMRRRMGSPMMTFIFGQENP